MYLSRENETKIVKITHSVMLMVGTLKHNDVLAHIIKLKFRVMLVTLRIEIYQVASCSPRLCYLYKIRSSIVTLLLG